MLGHSAIAEFAIAEMVVFAFRIGSVDLAIRAVVLYELGLQASGQYDLSARASRQALGLDAEAAYSLDANARADSLSVDAQE